MRDLRKNLIGSLRHVSGRHLWVITSYGSVSEETRMELKAHCLVKFNNTTVARSGERKTKHLRVQVKKSSFVS